MRCLQCSHWQPKESPKGLAKLGYAPCAVRSISKGHTFSAYTSCEQFKAATAYVSEKRRKFLEGGE